MIALEAGEPREAVREFERERSAGPLHPGLALRIGQAWRRLGDDRQAREWYERELHLDPASREAADSLRALDPGATDSR
jgi:tetratricopeptide (TPR) repeat protein